MQAAPPSRSRTRGAAALLLMIVVLTLEAQRLDTPRLCGGICTMLEQAHAYTHGGDPWTGATMNGLDPGCPGGISSMYTPASLWLLSPLSDHLHPVCDAWPWVQLGAYAVSLFAAASLLSGWQSVLMLACVLWVRSWLGDPFFRDEMTGNVASLEAAGVWTIAALGARSRWWSLVLVAWVTGLQKQVYWVFAALPLLGRRYGVAAAAFTAMSALHLAMWSTDASGYARWFQQARWHDERGEIHPALRSLVRDVAESRAVSLGTADEIWLGLCALVAAALWWGSRRAPTRVATGDGMLLCVLAYLAVTPYLKDYTLVLAVPAVAAALVTAHPLGMVALVLVQILAGPLGGYHALAVIWAALFVHGWRVGRSAFRRDPLSAPDAG